MCMRCQGAGQIGCGACAETGFSYEVGRIECPASISEDLRIRGCEKAVEDLIRGNIPLGMLSQYGFLVNSTIEFDHCSASSVYFLKLRVTEVEFCISGQKFRIYGFGSQCKVFDFQDIVSKLLADDLENLEGLVSSASLREHLFGKEDFLGRVSEFVRSDINLQIAEHSFDHNSMASVAEVGEKYTGLVDLTYIQRCTSVLESAFGMLYSAKAIRNLVYLSMFLVVSAIVLGFVTDFNIKVGNLGVILAVAGFAFWRFLEYRSLIKIKELLPPVVGGRVVDGIRKSGILNRWRLGVYFGLGFVLIVGFIFFR